MSTLFYFFNLLLARGRDAALDTVVADLKRAVSRGR
jgi:hypothetical protein